MGHIESADEMKLGDAVQILNRERHQDHTNWMIWCGMATPQHSFGTIDLKLTSFEAIAVAERYERIVRQKATMALAHPLV